MALKWKNLFKRIGKNSKAVEVQRPLNEHYDIGPIDKTGAVYRMIVGQRSNGKTYKCCEHIVEDYLDAGKRGAYIRRYEESITPKNIQNLFSPHLKKIWELSNHKWNAVFYRAKEFHMCLIDKDTGQVVEKDPVAFCVTAAINTAENTKGEDRGEIHTIVFDEFATSGSFASEVIFRSV